MVKTLWLVYLAKFQNYTISCPRSLVTIGISYGTYGSVWHR